MKYYLVENLKITVMFGRASLFIERGIYAAKNRSSLRHVIGREVWVSSEFDHHYQPYDHRGTSYVSKSHKITEVDKPNTPVKVAYRYSHGVYYLKTDRGWTPIPDSEVSDYIKINKEGGN